MPRRKDIWKCGIIDRPVAHVLEADLNTLPVKWLADEPEFTFLADPFGWQENETFHLFAEQYDYRTRRGVIERLSFDAAGVMTQRQPVLAEDWHLSYPFIFEGEGAIWMLPEAHRSGRLTLYRAQEGLAEWRSECEIKLDCVPVDASILRHDGRWWLFYSPATNKMTKISHLHVAWADRLTGPWTPHPGNPVRVDKASARPGGTPVIINGRIMVPMQDCTSTYGGAIRPLWVDRLSDSDFSATSGDRLTAPPSAGAYQDGLHTLSACGDKTLLDVKRIDTSLRGMMVDIKRKLGGYNR